MPDISAHGFGARGQVIPARGRKRARVGLLTGCVMPLVHGPQMESVVSVLSRNGCEVVVPKGQVCCGAIHSHVGDLEQARRLARRNIEAFFRAGVDTIVVASAGCGVRMKEYGDLLREDPDYCERATRFDSMVKDVHEFLAALPIAPPAGNLNSNVTYQDSCHLSHAQGITRQPRDLLDAFPESGVSRWSTLRVAAAPAERTRSHSASFRCGCWSAKCGQSWQLAPTYWRRQTRAVPCSLSSVRNAMVCL